jgi:hypothetical protein
MVSNNRWRCDHRQPVGRVCQYAISPVAQLAQSNTASQNISAGQVADVPILLGAVANETLGWADLVLQYLHAGNTTSTDIAWKAATVALFGPTFAPKVRFSQLIFHWRSSP